TGSTDSPTTGTGSTDSPPTTGTASTDAPPTPTTASTGTPAPDSSPSPEGSETSATTKIPEHISTLAPTTPTPKGNPCKNGGTWTGVECNCKVPYIGQYCDNVQEEIKVEIVETNVDVTVRITNKDFSDQLKDPSTPEYQEFTKSFTEQMDKTYRGITGYNGIHINQIRKGSVIVDHDVIFVSEAKNFTESFLAEVSKEIVNQLNSSGSGEEFVFDEKEIDVQPPNKADLCKTLVPAEVSEFYDTVIDSSGLRCLSACHQDSPNPLHCGTGKCGLRASGPMCFCDLTQEYWYYGDRCELRVHKAGMIAGVTVAAAVLLVSLIVLTIYTMKYRQQKQAREEEMNVIENSWMDEEVKWPTRNIVNPIGLSTFDSSEGNLLSHQHGSLPTFPDVSINHTYNRFSQMPNSSYSNL
ncbi:mucin-3B-like, partial [Callorhinchus milii]|uniref:mucin-3B-like n=1 Tax=Callorhinchus milii TaxID=7868 RepID=UPI001C3FE2E8